MNIAFVDLDGVIANNTTRFAQATSNGKINWAIALNGEHVHLDTLIDGVGTCLEALENQGYTVIFLTSRPWHMKDATIAWLDLCGLNAQSRRLEMKPQSEQYIKTVEWKAKRLKKLALEMQAQMVLFVDDEPANIEEVVKNLDTREYFLNTYTNLQDAVNGYPENQNADALKE